MYKTVFLTRNIPTRIILLMVRHIERPISVGAFAAFGAVLAAISEASTTSDFQFHPGRAAAIIGTLSLMGAGMGYISARFFAPRFAKHAIPDQK